MDILNEENGIKVVSKRREKRRLDRQKKIDERMKLFKIKSCEGTLFEKHVNKIDSNGGGYMAKHGTVLHYAQGTKHYSGVKTRSRKSYNGTENWSHKDRKRMLDE